MFRLSSLSQSGLRSRARPCCPSSPAWRAPTHKQLRTLLDSALSVQSNAKWADDEGMRGVFVAFVQCAADAIFRKTTRGTVGSSTNLKSKNRAEMGAVPSLSATQDETAPAAGTTPSQIKALGDHVESICEPLQVGWRAEKWPPRSRLSGRSHPCRHFRNVCDDGSFRQSLKAQCSGLTQILIVESKSKERTPRQQQDTYSTPARLCLSRSHPH